MYLSCCFSLSFWHSSFRTQNHLSANWLKEFWVFPKMIRFIQAKSKPFIQRYLWKFPQTHLTWVLHVFGNKDKSSQFSTARPVNSLIPFQSVPQFPQVHNINNQVLFWNTMRPTSWNTTGKRIQKRTLLDWTIPEYLKALHFFHRSNT